MATLKFVDSHNMVAFLSKPAESEGFEQIVDFLNAHPVRYALTVNPTIYVSCIEQFCSFAVAKTINGEVQLHALVDGKRIVITETSVRRTLRLVDAKGIDCFLNSTIFENLALMGYEKISKKLTFYKAFFSLQWKFRIHTILQCLSPKTTAWNNFSNTMASAIICLATNQKFNFSKLIFDSKVRNLDNLSASDEELKELMKDQLLPADASPIALSSGYISDSDPEEDDEEDQRRILLTILPTEETMMIMSHLMMTTMIMMSDCPELKNQNHENGGTGARGVVHALGGGETNQDHNDMEEDINA
ncbi:hypothetical protein Tco_1320683 [Tanacetum coccineum]